MRRKKPLGLAGAHETDGPTRESLETSGLRCLRAQFRLRPCKEI
jgi:hypothetical protein